MPKQRLRTLMVLWAAIVFIPAFACAIDVTPATTGNTVQGTIIHDTWDPGDPLTISGTLWIGADNCELGSVVPNMDSVIVLITPPEDGSVGGGHRFCGDTPFRNGFAPGTDANGNFEFTVRGGGVSFTAGDGVTYEGSIFRLLFKDASVGSKTVYCGTETRWPEWFGCDYAPDIYGYLASPDLNGNLVVDASDNSILATLFGPPDMTRVRGWQADFNHSGPPTVNAGDLSYFAGRLGKNCSSQKAGDDYDMDVTNLEREDVLEWLAEYGVTAQQVIVEWQAMGLSYDVEAAGLIASQATHATVQPADWTAVKELFK